MLEKATVVFEEIVFYLQGNAKGHLSRWVQTLCRLIPGLFSMYVPLSGEKDVGATFMLLFSADVSGGIFQL